MLSISITVGGALPLDLIRNTRMSGALALGLVVVAFFFVGVGRSAGCAHAVTGGLVGRRRRNLVGGSGKVLSGSRCGGPGGWRLVKLGLPAAAWRGAVPVQGGYVTAICYGLVRIRDGDERAGSFSAALAAWRGGVGALLLGSSGGTHR